MKIINSTILTIAISLTFQSNHTVAQDVKESQEIYLQVTGKVVDKENVLLDNVTVKLFKANETEVSKVFSIESQNHTESFSFNLKKNSYYSIEISKKGYFSRLISISTFLPDEVQVKKDIFIHEITVELPNASKTGDDYYLDFPVALITYNSENEVFENHEQYTKHIKKKMQPVTNDCHIMVRQ